jgi:hypothetical protein
MSEPGKVEERRSSRSSSEDMNLYYYHLLRKAGNGLGSDILLPVECREVTPVETAKAKGVAEAGKEEKQLPLGSDSSRCQLKLFLLLHH